ncbi:HpcH/HpaI aldolase/citrate lyase family protein [Antrihabitans cavernicola]|uniref:CoA ester lyase n=1 Tax=Antrihabitans cavernicola TaxID=2495913 RepID=A0A5A7S764_9NOCA|nr:CoA ester lyase [Spelaeibacter cavernicola]KAA0018408.1 CoA ester lyase [Spelaeibacter cavernicola]
MTWVAPGPGWLFCPADRPERFAKAAAAADVVILDLEDGVSAGDKAAARQALIDTPLDPNSTVVRVNSADTDDFALDLAAVEQTAYRLIMLPKCESPEQVALLSPREVIVLIESPLGALTVVQSIQADNAIGVMWGAEDLIAGLAGNASRGADGLYRSVPQQVRSTTLLAAKAYGRFALDSVYVDIKDLGGLRTETDDAVAVGFDGKVAIHPTQVAVIKEAYAPTADELAWAKRVLAAVANERGVFAFEGKMVDAPVLRHAERIVHRAT